MIEGRKEILEIDNKKLEEYKKQIDLDFEIFPKNKRLVQLEKSWIKNISHGLMKSNRGFIHIDRLNLRKHLLKYLNTKFYFPPKKKDKIEKKKVYSKRFLREVEKRAEKSRKKQRLQK